VLAGIKRKHARPPVQKETILRDDILADGSHPPVRSAGGLPRSDIVSRDVHKDDTLDSGGWIEIMDGKDGGGALLTLNAKTGWREVETGRGPSKQACPVHALEQWLLFAKVNFGPVFERTSGDGKTALEARLCDKHAVRLIKQTVLKSGIRSTFLKKNAWPCSLAIPCVRVLPVLQKSMSATSGLGST
jgi:hypothetical protein